VYFVEIQTVPHKSPHEFLVFYQDCILDKSRRYQRLIDLPHLPFRRTSFWTDTDFILCLSSCFLICADKVFDERHLVHKDDCVVWYFYNLLGCISAYGVHGGRSGQLLSFLFSICKFCFIFAYKVFVENPTKF
jgi:hypothetical protein